MKKKTIEVYPEIVNRANIRFSCMQTYHRNKTVGGLKMVVIACEMTKKECPWAKYFQEDGRLTQFRIENCEYAIEYWVDKHAK